MNWPKRTTDAKDKVANKQGIAAQLRMLATAKNYKFSQTWFGPPPRKNQACHSVHMVRLSFLPRTFARKIFVGNYKFCLLSGCNSDISKQFKYFTYFQLFLTVMELNTELLDQWDEKEDEQEDLPNDLSD